MNNKCKINARQIKAQRRAIRKARRSKSKQIRAIAMTIKENVR